MILAVEPKCSGFVNLCRQSCKDIGGPDVTVDILFFEPFPPSTVLIEVPLDPPWFTLLLPPFPLGKILLAGRSKEMSQKGSIVVDTLLQA